ncbi:iron-containing alcohol dehydrogenase [Desulforamulus reducens MI-1]|uniref:Iron-containing alcohol dehydrogenase n=1 Tax=Desulforamulus reducens (strain ATCC BAA-1160 / DSM 100696 / MI-1) TaxID=349161 RepID=A4J4M6_DESRM|nr:iron-containing alcohol dehydrogenase [Desulforamulus reducens]ABO50029.1 iron-containing alcohol dehydrogenase [Desulforamulus reducens MI-1]
MDVFKFVSPEIIFGPGTATECGLSASRLGAKRVFVVTDRGVHASGWLERVLGSLNDNGLECIVWKDVSPNPKDYEIYCGVNKYIDNKCDSLLAVGGGSPIDAAKAVALLVSNGGKLSDYEEIDSITRPLPPIVAVTTTAGSGSEVSQFSIIVNAPEKRKMTIVSKSLIPYISIHDPQLLETLNNQAMIYSGVHVLTHAIEAYVSKGATPMTDLFALNAITLAADSLRLVKGGKRSTDLNQSMAMANLNAGLAFSNAILGAVHAITHQISGWLDIPAGMVDAVLLPHVVEYNLPANPLKYARIAEALGEKVTSVQNGADKVIPAIKNLFAVLELPDKLSDLGINMKLYPLLAENITKDICLVTNPMNIGLNDVIDLLGRAC